MHSRGRAQPHLAVGRCTLLGQVQTKLKGREKKRRKPIEPEIEYLKIVKAFETNMNMGY